MADRTCTVEGCSKPRKGLGLCGMHYWRFRTHGTTDLLRPTVEQRFWSRLDRRGPDECWPWTGYVNHLGYGTLDINRRPSLAHRLAYKMLVGPIPEGLVLDHVCHNDSDCTAGNTCEHRRCCNPAHLEPVPQAENVRRGRGGQHWAQKTHCPQGHPYDEANTKLYRGRRSCRACNIESNRRYRARLKNAN